jgi:hypothetical protein
LALAAAEERIMASFDVKDFPDIGTILRTLERLFEERAEPSQWSGYTFFCVAQRRAIPREGLRKQEDGQRASRSEW